jgi:hypothetical protein
VPVVLGTDGNGIIDFNGNVLAKPRMSGYSDLTEIDFAKERISENRMWKLINGTDNERALLLKSRRPELTTN